MSRKIEEERTRKNHICTLCAAPKRALKRARLECVVENARRDGLQAPQGGRTRRCRSPLRLSVLSGEE